MQININKIAFGSLSTHIGDDTLAYTEGVSFRAREVDGIYVDNPPKLSRDYSSIIWKYYTDTDNYMMTHVQGLHVQDKSMARFFPYRGAYEVSRAEFVRSGMNLASVLDAMPRIKQYAAHEKWTTATTLHPHVRMGNVAESECLAESIMRAIDFGTRLYISMPTAGRNLRENYVFHTSEWNTLIEAIDLLDVNIRRYVSFAFCVDEHYADKLDDTLVVVYARESKLQVPQGCTDIKWEVLHTLKRAAASELKVLHEAMATLPGDNDRLLPLAEMQAKVRMYKERPIYEDKLKKDKRAIESAATVFSMIKEYKGRVADSALTAFVSRLDPVKHKFVIEELCASDQRDSLITEGLETILNTKAEKLGTDADAWHGFLSKLSDKNSPLETSIRLYMSRIRTWNKREVNALCKSVVAFQKAHPKKSNSEVFRLMVKTLNLEKDIKIKTEPKNPSNNMQEQKNKSVVETAADHDTKAFDELYAEIIKSEKKKSKTKQIAIGLGGFLLGVLATCGAWFAASRYCVKPVPEPVPVPTDTIKADSLCTDSLRLDSLRLDSLLKDSLRKDSLSKLAKRHK